MKRWTLWLIIGVMAFALAGLLYLQVSYIGTVYAFRNEQFDAAVRQALTAVSRNIEQDEMAEILSEHLDVPNMVRSSKLPSTPSAPLLTTPKNLWGKTPSHYHLEQLPPSLFTPDMVTKEDWVMQASKQLLNKLGENYGAIRELVIEMTMNTLRNSTSRSIYERLTVEQLEEYLDTYLLRNGIELPYIYEVTDTNGRVYLSTGQIPKEDAFAVYTQVLFSRDNPSQYYFLKLHIPGKELFLSHEVEFIAPSAIFTLILFVLFLVAITSLVRQKKLEQLRNDFISNMTHELKTPVATIQLGASMLEDPAIRQSPTLLEKALNSIMSESQRLTMLIDKVLRISFFDNYEKVSLRLEEVDMEEVLLGVGHIFSLNVEEKGGEVELELDAGDTLVKGDRVHLTTILYNLMENAVKYRREEVPLHITLGMYNKNDLLIIYIEDNGRGIKKEYLDKIFDRFFRVPTGNVHDVKGYGLGLAYVSRMVQAHKGKISAKSELGKGTKFIIELPTLKR